MMPGAMGHPAEPWPTRTQSMGWPRATSKGGGQPAEPGRGARGMLAPSTGGGGMAAGCLRSHLCLLFFRDPDSDLGMERRQRHAEPWRGAKAGQPQGMAGTGTRAAGWEPPVWVTQQGSPATGR